MGHSLVLVQSGASPDLKAETATTWTAGLDLVPAAIAGLEVSWTWFTVDYRNRIAQPALDDPDNILAHESEWASFITRNPSPAQIALLCESPLFAGSRVACLVSSPAAIIDYSLTNLASTRETGIDLNISQSLTTYWGELRFSVIANDLLRFEQAAAAQSTPQNVLNTVGNPIAFHLQAAAEWHRYNAGQPGLGVRTALHHTGDYRNPGSVQIPHVRSATTLDLQLFGRLPGSDRWSSETRLSLSIQNLFNQPPPFVDNPYGYDISNTQPLGRTLSVLLSTHW
jgi:outer membrane receptor protein involved in Fe transport